MTEGEALPTLLVMTSTYPRWRGDPEPGFVHELSRRLTDRFNVVVLGPHAPGALHSEILDGVEVIRYRYAPEALETLVNDGGIVANLRASRWKIVLVPALVFAMAWSLFRILRLRKIDVVHAHWLIPQGFVAALLGKFTRRMPPFVVTSHGADLFALKSGLMKVVKRWVIRRAAATTVVSRVMRDKVCDLVGDIDNLTVKPMGVDLRHRFVPDSSVTRIEDELLFVGRLVEKKGLRYLIDALPAIVARRPRTRLRIAGYGPEEAALRRQVDELGLAARVDFLGAVKQSELPALYRRAALFVAPFVEAGSGDQEGLGLVLAEAIGCGCAVLAGDVPAVRDVLPDSSSIIVQPRRQDALSKAIVDLLADPGAAARQAEVLRESLLRSFDWTPVSEGYAELLVRAIH